MNLTLCYFSPTGTTKRNLEVMAKGIGLEPAVIDLTSPGARKISYPKFRKNDIVIFAAPCYGGRLPQFIEDVFKTMKADGALCAVVSCYGNRAFDDQLCEMEDIFTEGGFKVIGAAAVLGEHSMSSQIAHCRPNEEDLRKDEEFGKALAQKIARRAKPLAKGVIPGNRPYKERGPAGSNPGPQTDDNCTGCGYCASHCPTGAISFDDPKKADGSRCIRCNACTKGCPVRAKHFAGAAELEEKIIAFFGKPDKEPEFFI